MHDDLYSTNNTYMITYNDTICNNINIWYLLGRWWGSRPGRAASRGASRRLRTRLSAAPRRQIIIYETYVYSYNCSYKYTYDNCPCKYICFQTYMMTFHDDTCHNINFCYRLGQWCWSCRVRAASRGASRRPRTRLSAQ